MGRLYDKRDLAFNLDYWDRQEQLLHMDIANGLVGGDVLDRIIVESRAHQPEPCHKGCGCRSYRVREGFDLERKRERMKLLRTGSLLRELDMQRQLFKNCPNCYQTAVKGKTRDMPCDKHRDALKMAKSAVFWAGERNLAERSARGQVRADGVVTASEALEGLEPTTSGALNEWESWYMRDRSAGIWPKDASYYDASPDYRGWLEVMRFQHEEMSEEQYLAELQRIREVSREHEETAPQWAGAGRLANGIRKGQERFQRDTRFNRLA